MSKAAASFRKATSSKPMGTSRITQLMVFLNGLILSATAFAALTFFVAQIRADESRTASMEIRRLVTQNLGNVQKSFDVINSMFLGQHDPIPESILKNAGALIPYKEQFVRIIWFENAGGNSWRARDLYRAQARDWTPKVFRANDPFSYAATILPQVSKRAGFVLRPEDFINNVELKTGDTRISAAALKIVYPVFEKGKITHVIAGFVQFNDIIGLKGDESFQNVARLIVRDTASGEKMLVFGNAGSDGRVDDISDQLQTSPYSWQQDFGDKKLEFTLDIRESLRTAFISKTPFLVLILGLTLTMIGTLYIRTNYRQSARLSVMNLALSEKNIELKNQIDESNRLFDALQRSEREYRSVIDSVSDIIFETDSNGTLLFLNATWERVTGISSGHALGRDLFDMIHPAEQENQRHAFFNMVAGRNSAYRHITRLRNADGRYRSVEIAISGVRTDEMRTSRVVGTITDVDERRRAEKALAETEKKYRTIVENAAGGIYQVGADGRILSANPALSRILGYDSPADLTASISDFGAEIYANSRDRMRYERELASMGFIRNHETEVVRKDGSVVWISENARAVKDEDGKLVYYEGSIEDITQRKAAEQALKDAKLESDLANRAKSEFLANMSHELRTPLNAVIGFSEIMKNEALGPIGQKPYAEFSAEIYDSGKRLLGIINDILDISRIEAGERSLNESLFSMNKVVETCIGLLGAKAGTASVSLENAIKGELPRVVGEELGFKQALTNLISNAIKFTPAGGRIKVEAQWDGPDHDMRLSVTDTGIGMDEKEIAKALSAFGQVETNLNRSSSGAGLGLTLVNALVRMHGGRLELLSKKGVGTTATLVIPASRISVAQQGDDSRTDNVAAFVRPRK